MRHILAALIVVTALAFSTSAALAYGDHLDYPGVGLQQGPTTPSVVSQSQSQARLWRRADKGPGSGSSRCATRTSSARRSVGAPVAAASGVSSKRHQGEFEGRDEPWKGDWELVAGQPSPC